MEELFNEYVNTFNLNDPMIKLKYYHSFRVINHAKNISLSLNLNDEDLNISVLCALLHDIGRFNQWKNYKTYNDLKSIDHALEGINVLKNNNYIKKYINNDEVINIIYKAIYNHNKIEIDKNLNEKEVLFSKITRDADKLDILEYQNLKINDDGYNQILVSDLLIKKMCQNELVKTDTDKILGAVGWIFDLYFDYSFEYLNSKNIIQNKLNIHENKYNNNEINNLCNYVNMELEKRKKLC